MLLNENFGRCLLQSEIFHDDHRGLNNSWLHVAKCNFGKVNLEAMLVSSFPSYTWGGPMPLAGGPRELYMQLLACSSLKSVVAIACCLRAIFAVTRSLLLPIQHMISRKRNLFASFLVTAI